MIPGMTRVTRTNLANSLLLCCETQSPADLGGTSAMSKHYPINSREVECLVVSEPFSLCLAQHIQL